MKLTIDRFATGDEGTQGKAALDDVGSWCVLELPWRDNHAKLSCIPARTYKAKLQLSKHFHRQLYLLLDVPDRTEIEMHPGNWAGDEVKGFKTDVEGCIMLGHSFGHLGTGHGIPGQLALIASREAISEFMAMTKGQEIDVVITWSCPSPEVTT